MPRKKTARRIVKRQASKNNSVSTKKMEQELLRAPAKLSAQVNKDIKNLKLQENKLKVALNKCKSQTKTSEDRIKTAAAKQTNAGKKQLKQAKKAYQVFVKNQTNLDKQLQATTQLLKLSQEKQAKLAALKKHLSQFEKDWAQGKIKKVTKTKNIKRSKKIDLDVSEPIQITQPAQEIPQVPNFETSIGDGIVSERTEINS